jgi:hypothetical protein
MRGVSVEPWDQVGNNVDICEDLVDEREKSASSDDDVACMQVTISLTLGRAGLVKAAVREVKAAEAFEVDNTVKGVAAGERRAALDRREGGEKGPTMRDREPADVIRTDT